jgi:hypothetical protein
MAAEKSLTFPVKLAYSPTAGVAIHAPSADEIGPLSPEAARDADDLKGLDTLFATAVAGAGAAIEMETVFFGTNDNLGDLFVSLGRSPAALVARACAEKGVSAIRSMTDLTALMMSRRCGPITGLMPRIRGHFCQLLRFTASYASHLNSATNG